MQLLIILALLMYGGKGNAGKILSEAAPMLESIGGDEMREALKSAEEISAVLSAVSGFAASGKGSGEERANKPCANAEPIGFPLEPVSAIADKDITYSLSQYIMQN